MPRSIWIVDDRTGDLLEPREWAARNPPSPCKVGSPQVIADWQEPVVAPVGGPGGVRLTSRADQREMCKRYELRPCGEPGYLENWKADPWEPVDPGPVLHHALHGNIHVPEEVKARMEGRAGVAPTAEPIGMEAV